MNLTSLVTSIENEYYKFENLSNYTENYYVYRSQYLQNGNNIRVEVL